MEAKLTTSKIEKCEPDDKDYFIWDTRFTGLGLKVNAGGTKSFVFQGRLGGVGNAKRRTIGKYPLISLQQAIDTAQEWSRLFAAGIDPKRQTDEQIAKNIEHDEAVKRGRITFAQAYVDYLDHQKDGWSKRYYNDHIDAAKPHLSDKYYKPGPFDYIWHTALKDLTPEFIEQWTLNENKTRASRMAQAYRMYKAFVNWANERKEYMGIIPLKSATAKIVTSSVQKSKSDKYALQRQQLKPWFELVLSDKVNDIQAAALICMLINGSRPSEMLLLKWQDVDFQWKTITIIDKVDQWERIIPLTPYVEQIMQGLPRRNDYVFGSVRGDKTHIKIGDTYRNALKDAGLPPLPPKAMRKSFSNLSEWVDVPYGIVKQIMGHRPNAVDEKHYKDRPIDLLRHWHIVIEQFILSEAEIGLKDD